jgi:hypothetical protein
MDGSTSTRRTVLNVALHRGDTLVLIGTPDGVEPAPVDYIEVTPSRAGAAAGELRQDAVADGGRKAD